MKNIIQWAFLGLVLMACGPRSGGEDEGRNLDDLKRAIAAIEDRKEAEERIIAEQTRTINILRQNLEKAKSEGMKKQIRADISAREITIEDARKNLANQNKILGQLYAKEDSLMKLEEPK